MATKFMNNEILDFYEPIQWLIWVEIQTFSESIDISFIEKVPIVYESIGDK